MTKKQELEAIANDTTGLYTQAQRDKATQALSKLENQPTDGFDSSAEMWADFARRKADPALRAKWFEECREKYKNDPVALRSFTPEREALRAKRDVYDKHGGDVIGQAYDEDIPALLAAKGRGYFGTVAYFVERKGMTQEAAKGQLAGAIAIMQKDIGARKQAIIGDNRYLQKQYPQPVYAVNPQTKQRVMTTDGGKTWQAAQ